MRTTSPFRSTWSDTVDLLDRELRHLDARNIVIQADCDRDQIRLDGFLRADARLRGPGVVLSFDSKLGALSYPCDRFIHWQHNIRAIALALEALRKVDRYGVTRRGEQYKGWSKLPAPESNGFTSTFEAAGFVCAVVPEFDHSEILGSVDRYREAYRLAAGKLHPDRNNGDASQFLKLQAAKELLENHHAI